MADWVYDGINHSQNKPKLQYFHRSTPLPYFQHYVQSSCCHCSGPDSKTFFRYWFPNIINTRWLVLGFCITVIYHPCSKVNWMEFMDWDRKREREGGMPVIPPRVIHSYQKLKSTRKTFQLNNNLWYCTFDGKHSDTYLVIVMGCLDGWKIKRAWARAISLLLYKEMSLY